MPFTIYSYKSRLSLAGSRLGCLEDHNSARSGVPQATLDMRAYIAIKYHADHSNRERIEGISSMLERLGFETTCITRDLEKWGEVQLDPGTLMQRTFREIDACDVVIVDLTEKGVGVGIEAGYAFAQRIPIVTIAQTGSDTSETLRGISQEILLYDHYDDLDRLFSEIEDQSFTLLPR